MQPFGTQAGTCEIVAADSSPSEWLRKLATCRPDLAAQMPDPSRLPPFLVPDRRDVQLYREKHAPRTGRGGRGYAW